MARPGAPATTALEALAMEPGGPDDQDPDMIGWSAEDLLAYFGERRSLRVPPVRPRPGRRSV
eukprot:179282-Lingulodinium_polyedra.AAC.1